MSLNPSVLPYAEPITLTEMKVHLKQDSDITTDDDLISSLIIAARDVVETMTGSNVRRQKVMVDTTFTLKMDYFPACDYIEVPRVPLVSVASIAYVDTAGDTQTWSSSNYTVDTLRGRIYLTYGGSWPSTRYQSNAVTITFIAGMAAKFTGATDDTITVYGRTLAVGDRIRVANSGGALPTGLSVSTDYYAIAASKLSLTAGGGAVDITGTGSGTNYLFTTDATGFETLKNAIKLLVAYWYYNREAVSVMPGQGAITLPMAVESLVNAVHA